ncbi:MAG: hypothetical protein HOD63_11390 [Bacteroidetes bacterium]|mgnify:FL=1|jgi:hypothetical protein|nr:hypothetical protein [Bacteroidota bacterium]MBT5527961.1 hypothetical protein [Cytophagia bacterium]MBT3933906.1 hypothetical protein [Bacteroidota bacterium]MBT4339186.1 hypothetical protein [Bacteroidota bacterium]MBT5992742.1 hypothetical protein [Bacteroidota bacterium]
MIRFNAKVIQLLFKPKRYWEFIFSRKLTDKDVFVKTLLPISILLILAILLGPLNIFECFSLPDLVISILYGFVFPNSLVLASSWMVYKLAKPLGSNASLQQSLVMISFSLLPYFIALFFIYIFQLNHKFELIGLLGIYFYYLACKKYIEIIERHFISYIIISVIITLGIYTILKSILGMISLISFINFSF